MKIDDIAVEGENVLIRRELDNLHEYVDAAEKAFAPVLDWYSSDEHPIDPLADRIACAVEDLQADRKENLQLRQQLEELKEQLAAAEARTYNDRLEMSFLRETYEGRLATAEARCLESIAAVSCKARSVQKTLESIAAEDINDMVADMIDVVLKTVTLTNEQEDELWDCIQPGLEKFFGYPNFRSYN